MVHRQKTTELALLSVGVGFTVLGVLMSQHWESLIRINFNQELALKPGSKSFDNWKLTPLPITTRFYFWNWTNPLDMEEEDYKPAFVEMGPYVFTEQHEKVNVTWNENGTISYQIVKRWWFNAKASNGTLSDEITSVNVIAASANYITRGWSAFVLYPVSWVLTGTDQKFYWTKNVSQLLFEGFDNSVQKIGSYVPGFPATDKFGWFYDMNGTVSPDIINMDTGVDSVETIGALRFWNYKNETDAHAGNCSQVSGFVGELWPPNRTKEESLDMFTTNMCRKVKYYFEKESEYNGIKTFMYSGTELTVDNGTLDEENQCYCDPDGCPASGVFNMSTCHHGAPIFLSYPHFYNADSSYRDAVVGMDPDPKKHKFYIELEPRTGVQLNVAARVQVNVYLKRSPYLTIFRKVPNVYIPVYWIETCALLSDEFTSGIKIMLQLIALGPIIWYGICIVGVIIITGVALFHLCARPQRIRLKGFFSNQSRDKTAVQEEEHRLHLEDQIKARAVKYVISDSAAVITT